MFAVSKMAEWIADSTAIALLDAAGAEDIETPRDRDGVWLTWRIGDRPGSISAEDMRAAHAAGSQRYAAEAKARAEADRENRERVRRAERRKKRPPREMPWHFG